MTASTGIVFGDTSIIADVIMLHIVYAQNRYSFSSSTNDDTVS